MFEKLDIMKNKNGFIAALDQSGGSSSKTLELYGIDEEKYKTSDEMFNLIHNMRERIIKSKSFDSKKIIGVILFKDTVNRKIDCQYSSDYLWNYKHIISFIKIDVGLEAEHNNVSLMKEIPDIEKELINAKKRGIFGTKMRSVIYEYNEKGIKDIIDQQFKYAEVISSYDLVPIIEPEISIDSKTKMQCEEFLKKEILRKLSKINYKVMFKFTLPDVPNLYKAIINSPKVVRVVALSGGYNKIEACQKLSKNSGMIASFSRALLEDLNINDNEKQFDDKLKKSIDEIYNASIK